jgi:ketosteroid isomerase-like protein
VREAGGDHAFLRSSIEVDRRTTQVWTFRDGRVVRMETFMDRALALEAAGLPK